MEEGEVTNPIGSFALGFVPAGRMTFLIYLVSTNLSTILVD